MTVRCLLVLGLLGALTFADYLILDYQIRSARHDATRIRLSAHQRTLVERTALLARYLVTAPTAHERANIRQQLSEAIDLLENHQNALLRGDPGLDLPSNPFPQVETIYFKPPMLLETRLMNYVIALRGFSRTSDRELTLRDSRLQYVRTVSSGKMLAALDSLVTLYQRESEARIALLRRVEGWVLATSLLALLGTGFLVFWPTVRRAGSEMKKLEGAVTRLARSNRELDRVDRELRTVNTRLAELAIRDPLTDLLNRRGLQEVLSQEIQRMRRGDGETHALLADLDDFKRINDTLGHAVGDIVLKEIALRLRETLRATDHVGRLGGDEFLILLPETRRAEALRVAEKVRFAISQITVLLGTGEAVRVTGSLGLVPLHRETASIDQLLMESHHCLYKSKRTGKNRISYCLLGSEQDREIEECGALPDLSLLLLQSNPFRAVRQPICRLEDGVPVGYEFLTRSRIEGFENPDDFFRVSSETNLVTLTDHQCFKTCVEAGASLPAEIRRHLNLFPSTLIDLPVGQLLEAIPASCPKSSYCVEISEQQIIGDPSYLSEPVKKLKGFGILIAVDDVGFGRSCLESLILLEPHILKIDKKCVKGIAEDEARARSLTRLLKIAEDLGTEVIAEGIETEADLERLKGLGVKYGQGFLLGKPG
jgi:diguanylate cyclase (GGDEF)-like protein